MVSYTSPSARQQKRHPMTDFIAARMVIAVVLNVDLWLIGLVLAVSFDPLWALIPIVLSMVAMIVSTPKDNRR